MKTERNERNLLLQRLTTALVDATSYPYAVCMRVVKLVNTPSYLAAVRLLVNTDYPVAGNVDARAAVTALVRNHRPDVSLLRVLDNINSDQSDKSGHPWRQPGRAIRRAQRGGV